uniref:RRM domain-containing protein n=1 Tax=Angiostrongylus cantonensis TaxID=6313 RepID=A0A0K0DJX0_ANGCA
MIPSFTASPVYDIATGIYYTTGATAVIPTPAYELIPHRVFVGGFPISTTELELREHFEQYTTIKEVKVIRSADGISKGYGFITLDSDEEADSVRAMVCSSLLQMFSNGFLLTNERSKIMLPLLMCN